MWSWFWWASRYPFHQKKSYSISHLLRDLSCTQNARNTLLPIPSWRFGWFDEILWKIRFKQGGTRKYVLHILRCVVTHVVKKKSQYETVWRQYPVHNCLDAFHISATKETGQVIIWAIARKKKIQTSFVCVFHIYVCVLHQKQKEGKAAYRWHRSQG